MIDTTQNGTVRAPQDNDEIDLSGLLAQMQARKFLIGVSVAAGLLIGTIIGQLGPNEYRAASVVQIEKRSDRMSLPEELIGNLLSTDVLRGSSFDTEIHVIKSRLILGTVVQDLGTDARVIPDRAPVIGDLVARVDIPFVSDFLSSAFQRPDESIVLEYLIVDPALQGRRFFLRLTEPDQFEVSRVGMSPASGRVGEPLALGSDSQLLVSAINAPIGRGYYLISEPRRKAVEQLRAGLDVSERRTTGIVDFGFTSQDPEYSVQVVNAVVEAYRAQNLQRRSAEINQIIAFIESQLPKLQEELELSTKALSNYRRTQENIELSIGTQELLNQLVEAESRIEELEFQEQQLAQRFTPRHPDYQKLLAESAQLQSRSENLRSNLQNVPMAEQELARLQERVDSAQTLELQLMTRAEQLRVLRASTVGNIRVLEPAEVAHLVGPKRFLPPFLGFFGGLVFGALLVVALNLLRRGIEDAREIEELGIPVIGSVNKVPELVGAKSGIPIYALARAQPKNIAVEAFRGLRTGMRFTLAARGAKTLMVTSCAPADGKTFVSLNFAMVNAQLGTRVLLIDADLHRGKLARNFSTSDKHNGLTQLLAGYTNLLAVTYKDPETGLDFIGTGSLPPNPAELFESPAFADLLSHLSGQYDLIVIDAPPVLAVTDAAIIGQKTDITLILARHLVTTKLELQSALKSLAFSGIKPTGVVINQYDVKKSRYGRYSGYQYGAYNYKYAPDS